MLIRCLLLLYLSLFQPLTFALGDLSQKQSNPEAPRLTLLDRDHSQKSPTTFTSNEMGD